MNLDVLTAISPIDGRYRSKTETLAGYFSEYALIRYRVRVEIEYFITLCELPLPQLADFDQTLFGRLRSIYRDFTVADAQRVKDIEKITNHDVKAVEYFIKERFDEFSKDATVESVCRAVEGCGYAGKDAWAASLTNSTWQGNSGVRLSSGGTVGVAA